MGIAFTRNIIMTSKTQQRNLTFVVVVGVIAVLAAVAVIIVSSNSASATGRDYSSIPQSRTADGAFVLGYEDAPITPCWASGVAKRASQEGSGESAL